MNALPTWIGPSETDEGFVADRRSEAMAALEARGLPTKKTEAFRFTPVRDLLETSYIRATGEADSAAVHRRLGQDDTYRVVIGNGAPMLTGTTRDGVSILRLEDAIETHREALERVLARLAPSEHFAAANTVSFDDVVVVVVPADVVAEVPVHLVHLVSADSREAIANPRIVVLAGEKSRVAVVESYLGDSKGRSFVNAVVEIDLAPGSTVDHVVVGESAGRTISTVGVSLGDDATYRSRSALFGGALMRLDHHVVVRGARATVDLAGVLHAKDEEVVDHHVRVDHRGPNGTTKQRFRGLAADRGTSVFDGIVAVHAGAPGCDVMQESKNLLLGADATVHAKPHLEIEVDEVVASHGTTVGSLDREQLFYLRARGIGEDHARALLTTAFVHAVLDDVPVESVKRRMITHLLRRLPFGDAIDTIDEEVS